MQAARGASLSSSGTRPRPSSGQWTLFAALVLGGYLLDQITKAWALVALDDRDVGVIGDFFTLRLVFNPGAAFGTGTEYTIVFTCLSAVAVLAILYFSRRMADTFWVVGLGVLLAGVLGNLTDRVFREPEPFHGHVIDFLSFGNFPVFNFADVFINVAAGVIILQSLRGVALDGTRERDVESAPDRQESGSSDAARPLKSGEDIPR